MISFVERSLQCIFKRGSVLKEFTKIKTANVKIYLKCNSNIFLRTCRAWKHVRIAGGG